MSVMIENPSVFRRHLSEVLVVCGASYVSQVNLLVDQVFVGRLGEAFLHFHVFVASLGLVAFALGRALGNAVLVTSGKEGVGEYIVMGLKVAAAFAGLSILVLASLESQFLRVSALPKDVARGYYFIFVLINACDVVKSAASAAMIRLGLHHLFVRLAVLSLGLNVIVSGFVFFASDKVPLLFWGVGFGTFLGSVVPLLLSIHAIRSRTGLSCPWNAAVFMRLMRALRGESMYLLILAHIPLLIMTMLQRFYGAEVVTVYGVSQRICAILMVPWHVSVTQTVKNLSSTLGMRGRWEEFFVAGERTAWLLAGIPLLLAAGGLAWSYSSHPWDRALLAGLLPLRQLFQIQTLRGVVWHRIHETTLRVARAEMIWSGGACCVLLWAGSWFGQGALAFSAAFLVSGAGYVWSMQTKRKIQVVQGSS